MDEDDEQPDEDDVAEEVTSGIAAKQYDEPDTKTQEEEEKEQQELEEARKERMDLMEVELKKKTGGKGNGEGKGKGEGAAENGDRNVGDGWDSKFQYLIGQSEVFAHFLAGEFRAQLSLRLKFCIGLRGLFFATVFIC